MIIQFQPNISNELADEIKQTVEFHKFKYNDIQTQTGHYLVCIGKAETDIRNFGALPGVADVFKVNSEYKLVSSQWKTERSIINLGDGCKIGADELQIIAGPCSVESVEHAVEILEHLLKNDIRVMRTMVFKPRSSPYSFRGIGLEGLKEISGICKEKGMKIISEVMEASQIEPMLPFVDIFQVGARNTQNYNLLDALGRAQKTVLLKRGISGSIDELLHSAEYIFSNGNENIILCERGIRTFENSYRNTFDINAIPILKAKSHLPVIADPSHAIGIRKFVPDVALAAIMAGADGVLLEVHKTPERAFSDGQQTLNYAESERLYANMRAAYKLRQEFN